MSLSEKAIKEFQEIYKKEYGKEIPYDEAAEAARNLVGLYKIVFDSTVEELKLKERLKTEPKGFHLMDGKTYNCGICHDQIKDEQLWYDKWGKKCLTCQDAVNKKKIPGGICYHDEKWYAVWEFDMYFKMRSPTVKKLIRQGILRARIVPKSGFEVMLLKENSDVLPPKKLIEHVSIPDKDDPRRFTITPWYEIYDPDKLLKGYKILPYLSTLKEDVRKNEVVKNNIKHNMMFADVINKIKLGVQEISDNSPLVWHQSEWAICSRLEGTLAKQFQGYDVDTDLVKHDRRRPDIVIHELGTQDNNLVAIQVKKSPSTKEIYEDIKKITETFFSAPYFYKYGVFISIGKLPQKLPDFDGNRIKIVEVFGWKIEPQTKS